MLDAKIMRAVGMMLARQARSIAEETNTSSNEVIDLAPLLTEWTAGSVEIPVTYNQNDVRTYDGQPWKCAQTHIHRGEPGWEPGVAPSLWSPYHATDAAHALPWAQPTGAHDMYLSGEYMLFTDGKIYQCKSDTVYSPEEYAQAWSIVTE